MRYMSKALIIQRYIIEGCEDIDIPSLLSLSLWLCNLLICKVRPKRVTAAPVTTT